MNDNSELVWSIPAGKTKTIVIPYVAYRQLMSESDWEKLDQDNMKLRFSVVQGSITVNVKLTGCLRYIQAVLEELVDCCQCLLVELVW